MKRDAFKKNKIRQSETGGGFGVKPRKIIPFDKTRRRRQWSLGDPPRRGRKWIGLPFGPKAALLILLAILFGAPALDAASLTWRKDEGCRVFLVIDGDTVRGWCPDEGFTAIRLTGFDIPEFRSSFLAEAWGAFAATHVLRWNLW